MARTKSKKARAEGKRVAETAEARARLLEAHKTQCPACGQANTAVIYGGHWFTDDQVTKDIEAGLVVLGEFTLDPNAAHLHCNICRHEW